MGYGDSRWTISRETIERSDADLVLIGTPIDLRKLIDIDKPALRVTYRLQEIGEPTSRGLLAGTAELLEEAHSGTGQAQMQARRVTAVVALGGNALMRPGERGTAAEQLRKPAPSASRPSSRCWTSAGS